VKKVLSIIFFFTLGGISFFFAWLLFSTLSPKMPSEKYPLLFYSNQCQNDLRITAIKAIENAKKSIFLVTFGFNDLSILEALEKKTSQKIDMKLFYDRRASPNILLSNHQAYGLDMHGLVHQKILIIDKEIVFLGSANMTKTSFAADQNMVVGFYHPTLAQFLLKKTPFFNGSFKTAIKNQKLDLFLLPDLDDQALTALLETIKKAEKSLFVAMFTLTHPLLIDELIKAKTRGVEVKVALSAQMALGASKEAIERLTKAKVSLLLSPHGPQLFHHKFALIDEKILIAGSTNWTRAAFSKNHDCFFILHDLQACEKKFFKKLSSIIETESSSCTNSPTSVPSK
jgi:cardiolipin synthase A/B